MSEAHELNDSLLFYITNGFGCIQLHRTAIGLFLAQQDFHQRGLPRSIGTDQTDFIAATHLKAYIMKEFLYAKSLFQAINL